MAVTLLRDALRAAGECRLPEQSERTAGKERLLPAFALPNDAAHHPHAGRQDRWRRATRRHLPPAPAAQQPEHHRAARPLHGHHDGR